MNNRFQISNTDHIKTKAFFSLLVISSGLVSLYYSKNRALTYEENIARSKSYEVTKRDCLVPRSEFVLNKNITTKLGRPYLNMGFPKMGSSTLTGFWTCGGLNASHYGCGQQGACGTCFAKQSWINQSMFKYCGEYDAYGEMNYVTNAPCVWPQIDLINQIHNEAPEATFVIIFRNISSWIESVDRWTEPDGSTLREALANKCGIGGKHNNLTDEDLENFFCNHVNKVRDFVKAFPSHSLIEVQLEDDKAASILSNQFGIEKSCWGHENKNPWQGT